MPAVFVAAVAELEAFPWAPPVVAETLPAPRGIAPFSAAVEADLDDDDHEATGRLILLHDPAGNPIWDGCFRCVTFAKATIDQETVFDQWRAPVTWSWLIDALTGQQAVFTAPGGTVTIVSNTHFGGLEAQPEQAEIELRASWTPDLSVAGLSPHVAAWQDLLRLMAGLAPADPSIVPLSGGRNSRS
jgi:hypothetical protein